MSGSGASPHDVSELLVEMLRRALARADRQSLGDVMARFPDAGAGNVALITAQCPSATHLETWEGWRALGRRVEDHAEAIKTLSPIPATSGGRTGARLRWLTGVRVDAVIDVAQTTGRALPPRERPELDASAARALLDALDPTGPGRQIPEASRVVEVMTQMATAAGASSGLGISLAAYVIARRLGLDTSGFTWGEHSGFDQLEPEDKLAVLNDAHERVETMTNAIRGRQRDTPTPALIRAVGALEAPARVAAIDLDR